MAEPGGTAAQARVLEHCDGGPGGPAPACWSAGSADARGARGAGSELRRASVDAGIRDRGALPGQRHGQVGPARAVSRAPEEAVREPAARLPALPGPARASGPAAARLERAAGWAGPASRASDRGVPGRPAVERHGELSGLDHRPGPSRESRRDRTPRLRRFPGAGPEDAQAKRRLRRLRRHAPAPAQAVPWRQGAAGLHPPRAARPAGGAAAVFASESVHRRPPYADRPAASASSARRPPTSSDGIRVAQRLPIARGDIGVNSRQAAMDS